MEIETNTHSLQCNLNIIVSYITTLIINVITNQERLSLPNRFLIGKSLITTWSSLLSPRVI
jgi:hypothetical protein